MKIENTNYVCHLIERAKEGTKKAFLDLCEINLSNIFTLAYRLSADLNAAKLITLRTFFSSWDRLSMYSPEIPYSEWLKNMVILDSIAELKKNPISSKTQNEPNEFESDNELLEQLILSLPAKDRLIFVLHDMERYSYPQIKNFLETYETDEIKTNLIKTREYLMNQISL
ncbi:MAG: hypothetical protein CVV24_06940 [Ignavibacteriae bacterium HGW-Ignavibacteriae-3]|nr:MAG: hypothetical protein CVV24_06940 [Ignavibacteriae bacterium HGW-Ignavibacteriae-3]